MGCSDTENGRIGAWAAVTRRMRVLAHGCSDTENGRIGARREALKDFSLACQAQELRKKSG